MSRRLVAYAVLMLAWWSTGNLRAQGPASEIRPATDAPRPQSPEASRAAVRLPAGFRLELVACEPLVREPSGVCWDERGQMFVCELHGYNLDGHYDILELNKSGKLDREVRRIQATDEAKQRAAAETTGTIKRLIDTDGDGRMDRADVWADDLPPCYGMCAARGGLIVACSPHILYLADRDGDGRAEVRETLFSGFPEGILERRMNCPQWGLDGWIYFGTGHGGTPVSGPRLRQPVTLPRTDFRIRADGTAIEPVAGITWGLGFALTETDERLVSSIGWPATYIVPLPWNSLARNPYLPSPSLNDANPADRRAYPISKPHPWRSQRADDPGFSKFYRDRYGVAESAPNGYFTSCCAPLVYLDSALPGLRDQLLACEPAQNLITRMNLQRQGSRLVLQRVAEEQQSEFLASTDQWFHPISLAHAPDGTIVISDFYREIIEDYSAIPRYLQQQYSLIAGHEHGRLWRLTHDSVDPRATPRADMSGLSVEQLADEIASPRHWRRQTAHRLLVERRAKTVAPRIIRIARESPDVAVILHALHTLDQLGQLSADVLVDFLASPHAGVRVHALRLAEPRLDRDPAVRRAALALDGDADPTVRLQLALSLGASEDPTVIRHLARLARSGGDDPWLVTAIGSSVPEQAGPLASELLKHRQAKAELPEMALRLLEALATQIGVRRDDRRLGEFLVTVASLDQQSAPLQVRLLNGLNQGLASGKVPALRSAAGQQSLGRLLASPDGGVSSLALQLAGRLDLRESPAMAVAWNTAVATASDDQRPVSERLTAVAVLSAAPLAQSSRLARLLDPRQPAELQVAVVHAIAAAAEPRVAEILLADFAQLTPDVRSAILDAICARSDRLPLLLDRLEQQKLAATDLPAIRRVQLLEHPQKEIRERAARLLAAKTSAERQAVLKRFQTALADARDPAAGKLVFEKTCAKCHQLGQLGFAVGPDLDSVRTRPDESLLLDILDPSGIINPKFRAYTVVTSDGRVTSGLLASESATSITLRREKNEIETILRKDIDTLAASTKSLMPEGIEKEVTPRQLADLLAYLRESLGPALAASKILFDDEPAFVEALVDGDGQATLVETDKYAGQVAMRMTPLQRSSPRISGWKFRIVEKPLPSEPGEPEQFRYLRLAWKTVGEQPLDERGVMVELADAGSWPPADQAIRRYYSGKNTTAWAARQIAARAPAEWTVVTVDLWADFGEFTLTGIAPTAMGGPALFDKVELLRSLDPR